MEKGLCYSLLIDLEVCAFKRRPDTSLLFNAIRFQLVDSSTLKKEVAEGVDLMVVRELTGG